MAQEQKAIFVYENFSGDEPQFIGTLYVDHIRGRENYSFQYDPDWIKSSRFAIRLDPDLELFTGRQFPIGDKDIFGIFADSSPERWGSVLMTRRERILANQEERKPRKLLGSDFLLGV